MSAKRNATVLFRDETHFHLDPCRRDGDIFLRGMWVPETDMDELYERFSGDGRYIVELFVVDGRIICITNNFTDPLYMQCKPFKIEIPLLQFAAYVNADEISVDLTGIITKIRRKEGLRSMTKFLTTGDLDEMCIFADTTEKLQQFISDFRRVMQNPPSPASGSPPSKKAKTEEQEILDRLIPAMNTWRDEGGLKHFLLNLHHRDSVGEYLNVDRTKIPSIADINDVSKHRRVLFKSLLIYHPDKHPDHVEIATEITKFLTGFKDSL